MDDHDLARRFCKITSPQPPVLIALMLKSLPDDARTRALDAARIGTGKVELRTRVESNETELVLVPTNGSEPLWLTRTPAYFR
jgi:hypothetical protein